MKKYIFLISIVFYFLIGCVDSPEHKLIGNWDVIKVNKQDMTNITKPDIIFSSDKKCVFAIPYFEKGNIQLIFVKSEWDMENNGIIRVRALDKASSGKLYENNLLFTIFPHSKDDYVLYEVLLRKK